MDKIIEIQDLIKQFDGLAFGTIGMFFAGIIPIIDMFNLPIFLFITPMFLFSGTNEISPIISIGYLTVFFFFYKPCPWSDAEKIDSITVLFVQIMKKEW